MLMASARNTAPSGSAQARKVERNFDVLAVRGDDFDRSVGRINVAGIVLEPHLPADKAAAISPIGAVTVRRAGAEGRWSKKWRVVEIRKRNMARGRPPRGSDLDAERLDPLTLLRKTRTEIAMIIRVRFGRAILGRLKQAS